MQRTAKLTISGTILAAILLSLAGCSNSGGSDSKDNLVAATVNGKNIMSAEVERGVSQQSGGDRRSFRNLSWPRRVCRCSAL